MRATRWLLGLGCVLLVTASAAHAKSPRAAKQRLSPLVSNNCLGCHDEHMLEQQRLTLAQWTAVIKKMQLWGAPIEPAEVEPLIHQLAAQYNTTTADSALPMRDAAAVAQAIAPTPDGPYQSHHLAKGAALYRSACLQCHGMDGRGSEKGVGIQDRPILWRAHEFSAVLRQGRGRMPQFSFSKADIGAILAHVRQLPAAP